MSNERPAGITWITDAEWAMISWHARKKITDAASRTAAWAAQEGMVVPPRNIEAHPFRLLVLNLMSAGWTVSTLAARTRQPAPIIDDLANGKRLMIDDGLGRALLTVPTRRSSDRKQEIAQRFTEECA